MKRLILFTALLLPLVYLAVRILVLENVVEPIKYIYTITGFTAVVVLFFSITISLIKKKINLIKYRRMIGLFGFFYSLLHFINFAVFDAGLDFGFILEETVEKPFIYLGVIALIILLLMAITSTKKLFAKYKKYHMFVYLALILITIHFIMAQKSITIEMMLFIGSLLVIGYYKLIQKIVKYNDI